jgi:Fe-S-cluster containining protein
MQPESQTNTPDNSHELLKEITRGLLYTHTRINTNTTRTLEASSFLYALIELLSEKDVLSIEELDERKKQVAQRLVNKFVESKIGLLYQDPECDKYTFEHEAEVDCGNRRHICRAICCKFPFALSRQDVEEGDIRWEFGRPYLIAHDDDGYCVHLDRESYRCTVWERRPVPCRGFDCEDNEKWKVWKDFAEMVINDGMIKQINDSNDKIYTYHKSSVDNDSRVKE